MYRVKDRKTHTVYALKKLKFDFEREGFPMVCFVFSRSVLSHLQPVCLRPVPLPDGPPRPHLHRDWAHPAHICTGTGLTPAHICTGTGLTPAHICTGTTGSRTSRSNALAHTLHLYDAAPMRRQSLTRNRRRCVRCTSC